MAKFYRSLERHIGRMQGKPVDYDLGKYDRILQQISKAEPELKSCPDSRLKQRSLALKQSVFSGIDPDSILVEAFALAREACARTLGMRPFEVQIIGALALHEGNIAQMQTGEGKTLAAVLPAYLNALCGKGVHVLTFNDYLAKRDAEWMGPAYRFLDLSVRFIQQGMGQNERKHAYNADITYITAKEAGFDFLRSQLCFEPEEYVQRPFHYAIVDEADSILIDEARVPLVIAGTAGRRDSIAYLMRDIAGKLLEKKDFTTDEYGRNIILTGEGACKAETLLTCSNLHDPENEEMLSGLYNALHEEVLLHKDKDYIVRGGKVEIVDEFTGRVIKDRHWPDGLQAAIEAKENISAGDGGIIYGLITLQHFLGLYPKTAGMTATAEQSAEEMNNFYGLRVVVIPPNRACIRTDHPDIMFSHKAAKFEAVIREVERLHEKGRPVLVGTISVEESETLGRLLIARGMRCSILNAKNDEREAKIIARAGEPGAITISTNMAGRGTDIKLGGADEKRWEQVVAAGGLYVIGTNRHESARIDFQLKGRAGRQGDPGDSRLFISLADDLFRKYRIESLIPKKFYPEKQEGPVENPVIRKETERAQRIVEGQNFDIRNILSKYSYLIEKQRQIIYDKRFRLLFGTEQPDLLQAEEPEFYRELCKRVRPAVIAEAERLVTLYQIDKCWAEHLAFINYLKEGIHLVSIGGLAPVDEFHKMAADAFGKLKSRIREEITAMMKRVTFTKDGIDLEKERLRGPSSTWTYLVNDDLFTNAISRLISSEGGTNSGFAVWAGFLWPLFMASLAVQNIIKKLKIRKT